MSEVIARANAINLEKLLLLVSKERDAHQPHQSACLVSVPDIQKAQSTDTDGSSFCSTSLEEDFMKGQIASTDVACSTDLRPSESMKEKKRPTTITLTDLQDVYHLPISSAAKKFDIGLTLLKKRCRELGLRRWPYRKLKSMDKLLQSIESVDGQDPQVAKAVDEVKTHKKLMFLAPSETQIEVGIKKFRQAAYKFEFKSKRMLADSRILQAGMS